MSLFWRHEANEGPTPPSRTSSLSAPLSESEASLFFSSRSASAAGFSVHGGASPNPTTTWRGRKSVRSPTTTAMGRDMKVRRWDGAYRKSTEWDCLRRDPELWFPNGNCLIHLYARGQSRRGPAFRVPFEALLATNCRPLLDRFLVEGFAESPISDISNQEDGGFFSQPHHGQFELYIPAPPTVDREQAFLYHVATRNFFAWMFGRSLVGNNLGGAMVGLLNSMHEFRSQGEDNVQAVLDHMDQEGYADMRNVPDHALAVLFFAEHFQFHDLWIDAFTHCTGMNDILITSVGFEHMSRQTRALITRSRLEMDLRLDDCGKKLSSFLSEELSESHLGLTPGARAHLDNFRTFLQSFYVAKLGYYPPETVVPGSITFPTSIYRQMHSEFQRLYDLLVDNSLTASDSVPISRQGGICVLQNIRNFDRRYKHESLPCQFPLLPEVAEPAAPKSIGRRFSWVTKSDKLKPDERLVIFSALTKATNRKDESIYDCSLVRAYRGFEKDCVFSLAKADKSEKLSQTEARKVRWLLIYSVLQTLISATKIPDEVRDVHNVPYNLCVLTAGCPPWKGQRPIETLLRSQSEQTKEDYLQTLIETEEPEVSPAIEIKPDIDYAARIHRPAPLNPRKSEPTLSSLTSTRGSVRRAINSLGSMPELHHPSPKRASFHEILVRGYGNGTNNVTHAAAAPVTAPEGKVTKRTDSNDSLHSSEAPLSSRWSNSSFESGGEPVSAASSVSSHSRRGSESSDIFKYSHDDDQLDLPLSGFGLRRDSASSFMEDGFEPLPLRVKKHRPEDYDYYMTITTDVKVEYGEKEKGDEDIRQVLVSSATA